MVPADEITALGQVFQSEGLALYQGITAHTPFLPAQVELVSVMIRGCFL